MKNGHRSVMHGSLPADVASALARLRADRAPLAARLDAIDLAIENLTRAYEPMAQSAAAAPVHPRRTRQGTTPAAAQRSTLLALIARSPDGLTLQELRRQAPEIQGKARSNALFCLRRARQIVRDGRLWRAA